SFDFHDPIRYVYNNLLGGIMQRFFHTHVQHISRSAAFFTLVLFVSLQFFIADSNAQWVQTGALQSGALQGKHITAFAASGTNIFAAAFGGIFRTTNAGAQWMETDSGITNLNVTSLTVSGTNIYAGTIGGGVFHSTNDGASWQAIGLNGVDVRSLAILNNALYAGTNSDGVDRTTDDGVTWSQFGGTRSFDSLIIYVLAVRDTTIYAGTSGGLFNATENSPSWTNIYANFPKIAVYSLFIDGTMLYAGTGSALYVYQLPADRWFSNDHLQGIVDAIYVFNTTNVFIGLSGVAPYGIYFSTDEGSTFTPLDSGLFDTDVRALHASGDTILAGTFSGGVFRSTNNGVLWSTSGTAEAFVYSVATSSANILAGTDKGIFVSTDNGTSWSQKIPSDNAGMFFTVHDSLVYAGQTNGVIFRSTNSGIDWVEANTGVGNRLSSLAIQDTVLFAGTTGAGPLSALGGVIVSRDSGTAWGPTLSISDSIIHSLFVNGPFLYAGTQNGFFSTSDGGYSWNKGNTGLTDTNITVITTSGGNIFAGTDSGGIFVSTNNGIDWTAANTGLTNKNILALAGSSSNIYAGTNGGVFSSSAASVHWSAVNAGLPDTVIRSLATNNTDAYLALGSNGVWRRPLSEINVGVEEQRNSLAQFSLAQNYPNPFSLATDIIFSVVDPSLYGKQIVVTVYNAEGKTIGMAYRGTADNETHDVHINSAALPSGNYYYMIECGGQTLRKQMTVVR
ncbi:MAG TPA: T9SS type A sorting domain-containing protein, partial [Candidatus Kapabacteria bacterium]|nr:T9SS type A sorting domain-containing protein [Candidatus Kapabacteria bacterium]